MQAFEESEFEHEWCAQHRMHLASCDAMDSQPILKNGITAIRRVVSLFKHSPNLRTMLNTGQKQARLPEHVLRMDCRTRWSSTYDMLERFIEQKPAIDVVALTEKNVECEMKPLAPATMLALERMMVVLKPIKLFAKQVRRA